MDAETGEWSDSEPGPSADGEPDARDLGTGESRDRTDGDWPVDGASDGEGVSEESSRDGPPEPGADSDVADGVGELDANPGECLDNPSLCNDGNPCTDDRCDPELGCIYINNQNYCDDADPCTAEDRCTDGRCIGSTAVVCDDGNPCTDDDCGPATGCTHEDNLDACNDGNSCSTNDTCLGGSCWGGPAPDCDDGNPCTDDYCDTATGCVHVPNANTCDDLNPCTSGDQCANGQCKGGPALDCDDGNPCTVDSCLPAIPGGCVHVNHAGGCDDGDACTEGDTCQDGECKPGGPRSCDDSNPCTEDSCDSSTGCKHVDQTGPTCDDGNACTSGDQCLNGACKGTGVTCDDGNPCTDDRCDNPADGCYFVANANPCNDGNACTLNDTCGGKTCVGGPPPDCDDHNDCTDDSCNPETGCVHVANTAPCDDGDACTSEDVCDEGRCAGAEAVDCGDSNPCTTDSCNPVSGCGYKPNSLPCSDGDACTVDDICSGGHCASGPARNCDDGNPCTDDSCDKTIGCRHTPNALPCNDGDACTTEDRCSSGSCVGGAPLNCDDGVKCTRDSCDPAKGCAHVIDGDCGCSTNADCNDGVADTCDCCCGVTTRRCRNEVAASCSCLNVCL